MDPVLPEDVKMMTHPTPPRYYWLWHLAALKVIDARFGDAPDPPLSLAETAVIPQPAPKIEGTQWDRIAALGEGHATVALIDTGVSRRHPNLATRIDARSIDLASHRHGARHDGPLPDTTPATREAPCAFFTGLDVAALRLVGLSDYERDYFAAMADDLARSQGVVRRLAEPEESLAGHGTACAGLLVGEPAVVAEGGTAALPPAALFAGGVPNPDANLLPYFGVDPFSTLLSIRTGFDEDAAQFIAAFLYAWHCGVDAIVLPRGLPDPTRSRLKPKESLRSELQSWQNREIADLLERLSVTSTDPDADLAQPGSQPDRAWRILEALVLAVAEHIPVFCAAGNDGESQMIYPASLAQPGNGVFAVGAVTPEGFRAGYSNYGDGLTLVAPSDDYEILNRHQTRLDRTDPMMAMHDFDIGTGQTIAYCPMDLVTTDLPGPFGYDGGVAPWTSGTASRGGGCYTAFGGTSGASCLAGGLAVLAQRARRAAGKAPLGGAAMKAAMTGASSVTATVAPGVRRLTPDPMNADDEPHEVPAYFFGSGLPDAAELITGVLALD